MWPNDSFLWYSSTWHPPKKTDKRKKLKDEKTTNRKKLHEISNGIFFFLSCLTNIFKSRKKRAETSAKDISPVIMSVELALNKDERKTSWRYDADIHLASSENIVNYDNDTSQPNTLSPPPPLLINTFLPGDWGLADRRRAIFKPGNLDPVCHHTVSYVRRSRLQRVHSSPKGTNIPSLLFIVNSLVSLSGEQNCFYFFCRRYSLIYVFLCQYICAFLATLCWQHIHTYIHTYLNVVG